MKNIIKITKVEPTGISKIDAYADIFKEFSLSELINEFLPYTRIFAEITVKNFTVLSADLIERLTVQYLHGASITFETPKRNFKATYKLNKPKKFYAYQWTPLDLSAPIPKSLAQFKFSYNGKLTTYLDAIKTLTSTRFLPNEIWTALDVYSRQQIDKCREYNRGDYSEAELWYKQLMKDCTAKKLRMYSPNKKTYFEAMAEISFEQSFEKLPDGLIPLNQDQLLFLYKNAPAYGVEIPQFNWRINSRKTEHGYTEEPERVYCGMSNSDWNRVIYDPRNENLPSVVRQNLTIRSYDNDKLLRDAYMQLVWLIKHMKDEALMPNWHRCPVCHKLYKESQGCECGYCTPIEFVQADNMFYGDASGYEDYEDTRDCYAYDDNEDYDILI